MKARTILLGAATACALAAAGHAHVHPAKSLKPDDPALLVEARQGGMAMSVAAIGAIGSGLERKAPPKSYRMAAMGLAHFATSLPALFDQKTSKVAGTEASPAIWSDSAGFAARMAEYRDATGALLSAIDANDEAAVAAALASTKAACKACHDTYQLK
ncbi:Cytochrome c' precursor [Tsuneonella dongtanensis]|uniref:Cytochrome c n=1 Tax=Tsuneonella dongtanensis TaxID=692370 RepID=A0A1B2ABJ2_9SPHN|nr:cytochrome c [Tsuneonella dongtanensis]ANY19533.1 Cytochrome c' precursor [Tsuneonella dongtanensis]